MAGKRGGIWWRSDTLSPTMKIAASSARWEAGLAALMAFYAPQVEGYAKTNAPWSDQTSNARNGLFAEAGRSHIDVAHSVPYGIYLETRWSGKYQIIVPTIKRMGPEVMAGAGMLLEEVIG